MHGATRDAGGEGAHHCEARTVQLQRKDIKKVMLALDRPVWREQKT